MDKCKPIYEFIVWENCNNNCKFCFQRKNPNILTSTKRYNILKDVLKFIDSDKFINGSHLLVVGGEIFHFEKMEDIHTIIDFYNALINRMIDGIIDILYINTNLLYNTDTLKIILNNIKSYNLMDRIRFTTSYDIEGRFKSEEDRQKFITNLKDIRKKYPELPIVTNTILTKKVCQDIISENLSIKNLMNDFDCWINLIPYIIYNPELSATREEIFDALQYVEEENEGYIKRYIENLGLNQDKLLYINKDNNLEFCTSNKNKCGHSINFTRYSNNGSCYICDLRSCFNGLL